jgi:hypothetical protein
MYQKMSKYAASILVYLTLNLTSKPDIASVLFHSVSVYRIPQIAYTKEKTRFLTEETWYN